MLERNLLRLQANFSNAPPTTLLGRIKSELCGPNGAWIVGVYATAACVGVLALRARR